MTHNDSDVLVLSAAELSTANGGQSASDRFRLQAEMQRRSRLAAQLSAIAKRRHDAAMGVIRNMR